MFDEHCFLRCSPNKLYGNIWRDRTGHGQSQHLNPDQDRETQRQGDRRKGEMQTKRQNYEKVVMECYK